MKDTVIDNIIRSQIVEDYLDFFENKDFSSIEDIFSQDCSLSDWNIGTVEGKDSVMKVFSNIFKSVDSIEVNIKNIHEDPSGILTCEMVLKIDDDEILVADIFEFDADDRIKSLRAYRGN